MKMQNNYLRILLGFICGYLLIFSVESELLSTQVAISLTFLVNMVVSYNKRIRHLKIHVRNIIGAFLLGALTGVVLK